MNKEEIEKFKPVIRNVLKYFDNKYGEDSYQSLTTLRMIELLSEMEDLK